MSNIYRIMKINVLSIIALPILLLAMVMKIASKGVKKAKEVIAVLALSVAVILIFEIIGSKADLMDIVLWTALFMGLFAIVIVGVVIILSLAGVVIAIIAETLSQGFEAVYAGLYFLFSALFNQCEKEYNQILEMSSPIAKGMACVFYKVLQGVKSVISFFLKNAVAIMVIVSILLMVGGLLSFNIVSFRDFGVSYWTMIKLFSKYEIVYGVVLYLVFYFGLSKFLINLGTDLHNWDLEMKAMLKQHQEAEASEQ